MWNSKKFKGVRKASLLNKLLQARARSCKEKKELEENEVKAH